MQKVGGKCSTLSLTTFTATLTLTTFTAPSLEFECAFRFFWTQGPTLWDPLGTQKKQRKSDILKLSKRQQKRAGGRDNRHAQNSIKFYRSMSSAI